MPYYSDELIDQVREANDIVDVIGQYVGLKKTGSAYVGLCPFHNEKTGSFHVNRGKQFYHCFGCGAGGNVFTFLMNYENMTFPEAVKTLADRAGIALPEHRMSKEDRARADKRSRLLEINREAAKFYFAVLRGKDGATAMNYFRDRQLTEETMQKWGLGYTGSHSNALYRYLRGKGYEDRDLVDSGLIAISERRGAHDKFWNRAMFPIMDAGGKGIAFGGRVMGEGEPKYLNSPETMIFNKSRTLFGLFLAKRTRRPQMILCEGYMDVISMHQNGFDNTVASLGTALTEGHAQMLKRYTRQVYLSYDSDPAGIRAALRAIPLLKDAGISCKIINMQPCKDPDEFMKKLGPDAYEERIKAAENSFMFTIRMLEREYQMDDPESNTEFFRQVALRISRFPEEIERGNYIQAVADRYHRSAESIRQLVVHMASQEGILARRKSADKADKGAFSLNRSQRDPDEDAFAMADAYARAQDETEAAYRGSDPGMDLSPARAARKGPGQRSQPRETGMRQSQRLLLTWITEDPEIYRVVKPYLEPMDFEEGVYRDVAEEVWSQSEQGGVNPARIMDHFQEGDEGVQREVARIFNTTVGRLTERTDRIKALRETLLRIKRAAMERKRRKGNAVDPDFLTEMIRDKKKLQELEHISIDLK